MLFFQNGQDVHVLSVLQDEDDDHFEEEDSDFEVEGLFGYVPGGSSGGWVDIHGEEDGQEEDAIIQEADTWQPGPIELKQGEKH